MLRVLVLMGAFLFFRAVLPRAPRWSGTATTPYRNVLDGMMSAQQVSSLLDEVTPYESWLASRRASARPDAQDRKRPTGSTETEAHTISTAHDALADDLRR